MREGGNMGPVRGEGNAASFLPGHVFRMERHPDGDHPYLLLRVEHDVRVEGSYRSGEGLTLDYRNRFEGQPAALAYRPQVQPIWSAHPRLHAISEGHTSSPARTWWRGSNKVLCG